MANDAATAKAIHDSFIASQDGQGRAPLVYEVRHRLTRSIGIDRVQCNGQLEMADGYPKRITLRLIATAGQGVPARSEQLTTTQTPALAPPPANAQTPAAEPEQATAEPSPGFFAQGHPAETQRLAWQPRRWRGLVVIRFRLEGIKQVSRQLDAMRLSPRERRTFHTWVSGGIKKKLQRETHQFVRSPASARFFDSKQEQNLAAKSFAGLIGAKQDQYDSTVFDIDRRGWGHNASKHLANPKKKKAELTDGEKPSRKELPATRRQARELVLLSAKWPPQKRGRIKPRTRPEAYWRKLLNKAQAFLIYPQPGTEAESTEDPRWPQTRDLAVAPGLGATRPPHHQRGQTRRVARQLHRGQSQEGERMKGMIVLTAIPQFFLTVFLV